MESNIKTAFDLKPIIVKFDNIIETAPRKNFRNLRSFSVILSSLKKVGLLEPLVVCKSEIRDKYKLMNGHLRMYAMKELGICESVCIVAKENERYTFDAEVNYLNPLQRSRMIRKAVREGVSPKEIADTFGIEERKIKDIMNISADIDPAVMEILKKCNVSERTIKIISKVKPYRQIQIAQFMLDSNNFSSSLAKALYLSSPESDMIVKPRFNSKTKINAETISKLNTEVEVTSEQLKFAEEQYAINIHTFVTAIGFMKRILDNQNIDNYITRHFPSTYSVLKNIIKSESIISE